MCKCLEIFLFALLEIDVNGIQSLWILLCVHIIQARNARRPHQEHEWFKQNLPLCIKNSVDGYNFPGQTIHFICPKFFNLGFLQIELEFKTLCLAIQGS